MTVDKKNSFCPHAQPQKSYDGKNCWMVEWVILMCLLMAS